MSGPSSPPPLSHMMAKAVNTDTTDSDNKLTAHSDTPSNLATSSEECSSKVSCVEERLSTPESGAASQDSSSDASSIVVVQSEDVTTSQLTSTTENSSKKNPNQPEPAGTCIGHWAILFGRVFSWVTVFTTDDEDDWDLEVTVTEEERRLAQDVKTSVTVSAKDQVDNI